MDDRRAVAARGEHELGARSSERAPTPLSVLNRDQFSLRFYGRTPYTGGESPAVCGCLALLLAKNLDSTGSNHGRDLKPLKKRPKRHLACLAASSHAVAARAP